jgi:hypothetical protein
MLSLLSISSMLRELWQTLHSNKLTCYRSSEASWMRSTVNIVIMQVREFWQTIHGNKLTCYKSSEGSWLRSPVNVVIAQHIVHGEGVLADNTL